MSSLSGIIIDAVKKIDTERTRDYLPAMGNHPDPYKVALAQAKRIRLAWVESSAPNIAVGLEATLYGVRTYLPDATKILEQAMEDPRSQGYG